MQTLRAIIFGSVASAFLAVGGVAPASAEHLSVAFSFAKPPYVFAEKQDTKKKGKTAIPLYFITLTNFIRLRF